MTSHFVSSREFSRDPGGAKKTADDGPVFITNRDRPAHVLLSIDEYRRLSGAFRTLVDALAMPGLADIALDVSRPSTPARGAEFD